MKIDRRVRLLRAGQRVLDLGAAPGSWSLYTAQKIGRGGKLLAVDLPEGPPWGRSAKRTRDRHVPRATADLKDIERRVRERLSLPPATR